MLHKLKSVPESEDRGLRRITFIDAEKVFIRSTSRDGKKIELKVKDYSSNGALVTSESELDLLDGFNADLFFNGKLLGEIAGCYLIRTFKDAGVFFYALKFDSKGNAKTTRNLRKLSRIKLNKKFSGGISFEHPLVYDEMIFFNLLDLSIEGASVTTSKRNGFLLVGMEIKNAIIQLPIIGEIVVDFRIRSIDASFDDETVRIGIKFENIGRDKIRKLETYLLTFADKNANSAGVDFIKKVKESGFSPKFVKSACTFSLLTSEADEKKHASNKKASLR